MKIASLFLCAALSAVLLPQAASAGSPAPSWRPLVEVVPDARTEEPVYELAQFFQEPRSYYVVPRYRDYPQGYRAPRYQRPRYDGRTVYVRPPAARSVVPRAPRQVTPAVAAAPMRRAVPEQFQRQTVSYDGPEKAGTIVINTSQRFLYLVQSDGKAMRYGVGVGRDGFSWNGTHKVTAKKEWPSWYPPAEMRQRRPELPKMMEGGPNNPLGARAMYLGSTLYRIHGSNEPWTIGTAVSSGCFRMTNEDVQDLYERVPVGTTVKVI